MKVSFILKTQAPAMDGRCLVLLRITENSKSTYKSTTIKILPKQWDKKAQRVQKHIESDLLNEMLHRQRQDTEAQIKHLQKSGQLKNGQQVKRMLENKVVLEHDFFSFADVILNRYTSAGQISTRNKNKSIAYKMKWYLKGSKPEADEKLILPLQSVNIQFMEDYATFCRATFQNMDSTIQKDAKFISNVMNKAVRENHVKQNFMKDYKLKIKKFEKVYLTENELQQFINVQVNTPKDQKAKDAFIFSARYSGLRASDLIALKVGDIRNWHGEYPEIRIRMQKTSDWLTIPLEPPALNHLMPYCIGKGQEEYVFNFYEGRKTNFDDPEEFEKDYKAILAYYNRQLEKLGIRAGLEKKLTSHVARNSYATSWISKERDIYVLSKILGHHSLNLTSQYALLLNIPLHKAVRKLSGWGNQEVKGTILNQSF